MEYEEGARSIELSDKSRTIGASEGKGANPVYVDDASIGTRDHIEHMLRPSPRHCENGHDISGTRP